MEMESTSGVTGVLDGKLFVEERKLARVQQEKGKEAWR